MHKNPQALRSKLFELAVDRLTKILEFKLAVQIDRGGSHSSDSRDKREYCGSPKSATDDRRMDQLFVRECLEG